VHAAVLSVGSELLRGDIIDTNAAFLTRELSRLGLEVRSVRQIGDDLPLLTQAISSAIESADVVLTTGGLGPTQDDLTREAIASALGEETFLDDSLADQVRARFASMKRNMPQRNLQQAMLIPSATAIENPNGTAPGWIVRRDGRLIVAMPGPPREMVPMWTEAVRPAIEQLQPEPAFALSLMTFGLGESAVEQRINDVIHWRREVTVATYAKQAGVEVHVTARAATRSEAKELAEDAAAMLRGRLGHAVFGTGETTLSSVVGEMLRERGWTIAVMESASGGELSSLLTDIAGSSDYFRGGVVAYSRDAKAANGVDPDVMSEYGVVSAETARSMATAIRRGLAANIGVGVTGVAGSETVEGKAPGTCFIAVETDNSAEVREVHRPGARDVAKRYFAQCALDLVRRTTVASAKVST
jgi:nicotinamide-nucleotide amidase